jgi:hypothetical protein
MIEVTDAMVDAFRHELEHHSPCDTPFDLTIRMSITAALAAAPDPWRDISTVPKDGSDFLGVTKGGTMMVVSYEEPHHGDEWCWLTEVGMAHRGLLKFWTPIPPSPKDVDTEKAPT